MNKMMEIKTQESENFISSPEYAEVTREVRPCLPRYRNEIGKFSIHRNSKCINCGKCVKLCPHQVHIRPEGYKYVMRPYDYRCIGDRT